MKKNLVTALCAVILLSVMGGASISAASASVMIMPMRVYFNDGERMKTVSIINRSRVQALYRMDIINQRQQPDGTLVGLSPEEKPAFDLADMIVFSPRQVSLGTQGRQVVRMSLRRPADLPDGEYRTYIRLTRMLRRETEADAGRRDRDSLNAGVGINVGFAVPVVMRKGAYDAAADLQNFKLLPPQSRDRTPAPVLTFEIARAGIHSTIGSVEVFWTPEGGEERRVGLQHGVNVFPDIDRRFMRIPLAEATVRGGKIRVRYQGMDIDQGRVFDEKEFPTPAY